MKPSLPTPTSVTNQYPYPLTPRNPKILITFYVQVFDREGDDGKFVSVTVKATDQGEPSLEGVCSFTVEITDVNDNPPLFDRQVTNILSTESQLPPETNYNLVLQLLF